MPARDQLLASITDSEGSKLLAAVGASTNRLKHNAAAKGRS
jgi:hypothetical protein